MLKIETPLIEDSAERTARELSHARLAANKPTANATPPKQAERREPKKRKAVTLEDAAKICGVSVPTIRNWEAGKYTPEGWPGLDDIIKLGLFAKGRESTNFFKQRVGKAVRYGNMDAVSPRIERGERW